MATFQKLADNWDALTNAEKIALFQSVDGEATIADLQSLGQPFKILTYSEDSDQPSCTVNAAPFDQVVVPTTLIDCSGYDAINSVAVTNTVSSTSSIRIAVTNDKNTYYVYDTTDTKWVEVDKTTDAVLINGMTADEVAAVPADGWLTIFSAKKAIGFAVAFSMGAATDDCAIADLTLNVDKKGPWESQVQGAVYDYSYTNNATLQVKLYKDGTYKINYNPGSAASSSNATATVSTGWNTTPAI